MPSICRWAAVASLLSHAVGQTTVSVQLTDSTAGYSDYINPSFAGFGIEPSNLFSFTGGSEPNKLTFNLLDNLVNYTGAAPHIRLGGNTQDYMVFQQDQNEYAWVNNPNPQGSGAFAPNHMVIGPKFFEVANRFPDNTPITWGLNLGYEESDAIDQVVLMAKQVRENIPRLNLVSFEIGNEPDLYLENGFRTGQWDGNVYTQQWLERASAIWDQVLKPNGLPSNFFEPAATASTIGTSFQIQDLMTFGIDVQANDSDASYVACWNQHDYYYYIGVSTYAITLEHFMTMSTTNEQFASWVEQIGQSRNTPYSYALREMGVVGPIGLAGITDVFGAALWTLNFFLYAATLNITSVQMHMTDNSNASAWQPIDYYGNGPHVRPGYYGFAAFDQIIGPSCEAQVAPYTVSEFPAGYEGKLTVYSVLQGGQLATIVVINSQVANVSDTTRESVTVQLSVPSSLAGQTLYLSYLTADGADATEGTVWNGLSYEQSGDGTATVVDDQLQTVSIGDDGSVSFSVKDSEAVVANVRRRVGTGLEPNRSACAAMASRSPGTRSSQAASAASSNGRSSSGSSEGSNHNGVSRVSATIFGTLAVSLAAGALLIWT